MDWSYESVSHTIELIVLSIVFGFAVYWALSYVTRTMFMSASTRTIKGSELQSTKEGRQLLASLQESSLGGPTSKPLSLVVKPCKNCEGSGLLVGPIRSIMGMDSNMHICEDCGGSGLEGGTDYTVEYCKLCTDLGQVHNGCRACSGTGVVKIRKNTVNG